MKFLHIGDVHLGARPEKGTVLEAVREKEIWDTFRRAITLAVEREADFVFITGDLFHRQPLMRELKELRYIFSQIPQTEVVIIAGNHDYLRPDSYYRTFDLGENVSVFLEEEFSYMEFPERDTYVYGMSYCKKEITEPLPKDLQPEDVEGFHILLLHGGDEKHIPFLPQEAEQCGFDYVAMGHIHKPCIFEGEWGAYAGSLEPLDVTETGQHGCIYGEILETGIHLSFLPLAKRSYIKLVVPITSKMVFGEIRDNVLKEIEKSGKENMFHIILTGFSDKDVIIDKGELLSIPEVIRVEDNTEPEYDFETLLLENKNTIIGRYIQRIAMGEKTKEAKEALYYGVRAMLDRMR